MLGGAGLDNLCLHLRSLSAEKMIKPLKAAEARRHPVQFPGVGAALANGAKSWAGAKSKPRHDF